MAGRRPAQILGEDPLQLPVKFDAFVQEHRATHIKLVARMDHMEGDTGAIKGELARTRTIQDTRSMEHRLRHGPGVRPDPEFRRPEGDRGKYPPRASGSASGTPTWVTKATDGTDTNYITMEVSFREDLRNCNRSIGNGRLIKPFTGKPAQAALASVRNKRHATEAVESGDVYWHQLEDRMPGPEGL